MHNQMRYDQFYYLDKESDILDTLIENEKEQFEGVKTQIDKGLNEYIRVSESRIDPRSQELPEQYDEYMYSSKVIEKYDR